MAPVFSVLPASFTFALLLKRFNFFLKDSLTIFPLFIHQCQGEAGANPGEILQFSAGYLAFYTVIYTLIPYLDNSLTRTTKRAQTPAKINNQLCELQAHLDLFLHWLCFVNIELYCHLLGQHGGAVVNMVKKVTSCHQMSWKPIK